MGADAICALIKRAYVSVVTTFFTRLVIIRYNLPYVVNLASIILSRSSNRLSLVFDIRIRKALDSAAAIRCNIIAAFDK
jgi:hypothetical protein